MTEHERIALEIENLDIPGKLSLAGQIWAEGARRGRPDLQRTAVAVVTRALQRMETALLPMRTPTASYPEKITPTRPG